MARGWERVEERTVLANPRLTVREDRVLTPNGESTEFTVGVTGTAVFIVATDDDERVLLVRQHRYPVNRWTLELPAGGVPSGSDPLEQARVELAEETGAIARSWSFVGRFHPMPGRLASEFIVYAATGFSSADLRPGAAQHDEWIDEIVPVPPAELGRLTARGELSDACSLAALALWWSTRA